MLTASRLTSTSTAAAIATPESPHAIPSPEVAAGGTRAIAIATPTRADPEPRIILIAPAMPDPRARKRDRKLGLVLSATCGISRISRPGGKSMDSFRSTPSSAPIAIASRSPPTCIFIPLEASFLLSRTVPTLADMAGPISGATTIAPIIVAAESSRRPPVAITVLRTRNAI